MDHLPRGLVVSVLAGSSMEVRPLKVVHVVESTATGTLSMVCLIANRLAREGHVVHIIYSIREDTPKNLRELFDSRITLTRIQMNGSRSFKSIMELRAYFSRLDPDIVHLHSSFAGFIGRMALLGMRSRSTCFYSPHCISFMRRDISPMKKFAYVMLERIGCLKRATYIACSESERDEIWRSLRQRATVVENAVDVAALSQPEAKENIQANRRVVVTVGGIRTQKNPRLFADIARRLIGRGLQFLWIGEGDAIFEKELREAGVEVTGWMSRQSVFERVRRSGIYLSTSSWEGMPVSVIEAMVVGTPPIVSSCAGNVDVVQHMHDGAIYTDASEAAILITRILDDRKLYADMASHASSVARRRFSEDRFFADLLTTYATAFACRPV
ncbi:Glycosyltransferase involved in cell wall bisynthesis [Paraburkholderia tropica]|uniref:Glycosyltransferase involved in cell wall bisynthesis n=2 Tax=Paraburkholderia tropica TaxID=92647 RepID=A0AAQ1GLZ8_9BURK|nr:glycosyltransferase [Paraburkholderia tropica]SEK11583.1 Glycosyltransferase involved in cell wall bisynthesis [Paraburkholderia tropica]